MIRNTTINPESPLLKAFTETSFPEVDGGRVKNADKNTGGWKADQATFSLDAQVALSNRAGLSAPDMTNALAELAKNLGYTAG